MYYLCKKYSMPTPETVFPRNRDDVIEFLKDATFPVMLKGINTVTLLKRIRRLSARRRRRRGTTNRPARR